MCYLSYPSLCFSSHHHQGKYLIKKVKYLIFIRVVKYQKISTGNRRQVRGQALNIFLYFLSAMTLMTAGTKYYLQNQTVTNI